MLSLLPFYANYLPARTREIQENSDEMTYEMNRMGYPRIAQGTGTSFKFEPIDKLTPSHERTLRTHPIMQHVLGVTLHKTIQVIYSWDCIMLQ